MYALDQEMCVRCQSRPGEGSQRSLGQNVNQHTASSIEKILLSKQKSAELDGVLHRNR